MSDQLTDVGIAAARVDLEESIDKLGATALAIKAERDRLKAENKALLSLVRDMEHLLIRCPASIAVRIAALSREVKP